MVSPIGFVDRQIVDGSEAPLHHARGIEFPVLVSVRAEPVAAVVMPLVSEPHGDTVVGEGPQFFDQTVISNPTISPSTVTSPVETMQIAPTILETLGLDPNKLTAVQKEAPQILPGLGGGKPY
jgi:hypothetical protein